MSNPSSAWQRLQAGNQRFYAQLRSTQRPLVADRTLGAVVFRCTDAQVASHVMFCQGWSSVIDVSTWGHVVDTGVLATLEHAVETLKTPLIVVLGHSGCAAMHVALEAWNNISIPAGATRAVVEQAMSSLTRHGATCSNADELAAVHVADTGVSLLHKSAVIADAVDNGRSAIVCAVTDVDGRIRTCATIGDVSESGAPLLECV